MTQDSMMTKPIGESAASDAEPVHPDHHRARRRLGGWQLPGDSSTVKLDGQVTLDSDDDWVAPAATAPFVDGKAPESLLTAPLPPRGLAARLGHSAPVETSPIARRAAKAVESDATATFQRAATLFVADAATAPMATATAPMDGTVPFATGDGATLELAATSPIASLTAPMADATVKLQRRGSQTMEILQSEANTTPISDSTKPIALARSPIEHPDDAPDSAASDTVELTAKPSPEALAEIEKLKKRAKSDPNDSDALFQLSVVLHRAGLRRDAREVLSRLVSLYEQRGQHQQAARIKGMLGAPKTGPIATEELPARTPTGTMTSQFGGRTAPLQNGATVPLRNATAAIGRAKELAKAKSQANVHAFSPDSMLFTIPLPGSHDLPDEARDLLRQSDEELKRKQYLAAFDTCVQVISLVPDYTPIYLRLAEIYTRQRLTRRARAQADALVRLAGAANKTDDLWMVYRVLLHATGGDTTSLKRLVELLIDAGQTEQASIYASRLIQILDSEGLNDEALAYSIRLCEIIPGDTRAALENAILRLNSGDRGGALDRWESAVSAGADPIVAKASVAALTALINEDDHWRMLAEVIPVLRARHDRTIIDSYTRTAAALPATPTLMAGHGLLLIAVDDLSGRELLTQAAGSRSGAPISRASAAVALAWTLAKDGHVDEYVAACRTALKLLKTDEVANHPAWEGLVGRVPRFEDLSLELGEALLTRGDAAGAADVLKDAHARSRHHGPICERLADAYFKIGQLGSALTVLDELAVHYRASGQLEAMAGVLRQMSQLAPNNLKVKSRLIDAYLQRGFVAEARAELIQRADLEERSGLIKDALTSLQRAADLSWTIGLAEETFALYSRVIAMAPDDVGNRSSLVNFYLQMGRLTEAAEHQRAVVDIALRNDHKHEAIAALHQVIGLTPDDTSAYYQLADLLSSMGEYRQAEKVYRRLVLMNPADAIAQAKATSMAALRESKGQ